MENYIRRVRVSGLFEQETELVIDFDQSINCIYGVNGTGKTALINLIVNALKVNIQEDSNEATVCITVKKEGDDVNYIFLNSYEYKPDFMIGNNNVYKVVSGRTYIPTNEIRRNQQLTFGSDASEQSYFFPTVILKRIIMSHVSLTYVPLLRNSSSYDYRIAASELRRHRIPEDEISEIIDPNNRVLKELQEEFSKRYASAQSEIARRLESLSSIIFEKLLLEISIVDESNDATDFVDNLLKTNRIDCDDTKIESVISQIRDLNLNIPEAKIREHYQTWSEIQSKLLQTNKSLREINKSVSEEEKENVYSKYSEAYFNLVASARVYKKLEDAINEIEKVHLSKQFFLSPFVRFKLEINQFLSGGKNFTFDDSGAFIFTNKDRNLDISKLSSGEKHLIAILGRVCFSSFSGTSTFIARIIFASRMAKENFTSYSTPITEHPSYCRNPRTSNHLK